MPKQNQNVDPLPGKTFIEKAKEPVKMPSILLSFLVFTYKKGNVVHYTLDFTYKPKFLSF